MANSLFFISDIYHGMMSYFIYNKPMMKIIFTLFAPLLLSSCQPDKPLKIGVNNWIGYDPIPFGMEKGFIPKEPFHIVEFASTSDVMSALRQGTIDVAGLTLDEAIIFSHDGYDFSIILVMDISHGADTIIAKPEIKSFSDLKGKKIAVENTALGSFLISRALEIKKMKLEEIEVVHSQLNDHISRFNQPDIAAVVTFEPTKSKLLSLSGHEIFNSKEMKGEIIDIIVVKTELLKSRREDLRKLASGWFKTINSINKDSLPYKTYISKKRNLGFNEIKNSLDGLSFPSLDQNKKFFDSNEKINLFHSRKIISEFLFKKEIILPQNQHKEIQIETGLINSL